MNKKKGRVVGLDVHPDSFAGAVVEGSDPASAQVLSTSRRVELEQLEKWASSHTNKEDILVLEASGNAFAVAARLRRIGREVEILRRYAVGASTPEVAEELGIPSETVRHQVRRIQEKLQVADLPQAVAVAIRRGLIG